MTKINLYTYLGTNGVLTTPIHLEGIYYVKKVRLIADDGKVLTKNNKDFKQTVVVEESDVMNWYEVGQK